MSCLYNTCDMFLKPTYSYKATSCVIRAILCTIAPKYSIRYSSAAMGWVPWINIERLLLTMLVGAGFTVVPSSSINMLKGLCQ